MLPLPTEILEHIISYCDNTSRLALRQTCVRARLITNHDVLKVSNFMITPKMTRFAVSNGCPLSAKTFELAAKHSSLSVLKTLKKLGCVRSSRVSRRLVFRGKLNILKWMEEERFAWDCFCCAIVSESKTKSVLRWLARTKMCKCFGVYHFSSLQHKRHVYMRLQ